VISRTLSTGHTITVDDCDAHLLERAWWIKKDRNVLYAVRWGIKGVDDVREVRLHREVMGFANGDPMVDHRDGDGLNCTRENLRSVCHVKNARNRSGAQRNNQTSMALGVNFYRGKWQVRIRVIRTRIYVGSFSDIESAISARTQAEVKHWGIEPRRMEALATSPLDGEAWARHLSAIRRDEPHTLAAGEPAASVPSDAAGDL